MLDVRCHFIVIYCHVSVISLSFWFGNATKMQTNHINIWETPKYANKNYSQSGKCTNNANKKNVKQMQQKNNENKNMQKNMQKQCKQNYSCAGAK
jgi:uncharacterized membrane protein (DUF106 family)